MGIPPNRRPTQAARWANTAYKVTKCIASIATGDVIGGISAAAQTVVTCEEIRDKCILEVMSESIYVPDDAKAKGWKVVGCWATYWFCKLFK